MKISWTSLFVLVNFFGQLTNGQKDEEEMSGNLTNVDTITEKALPDKPILPDPKIPTTDETDPTHPKYTAGKPIFPPYLLCTKASVDSIDLAERCPSEVECDKLGNECLSCTCTPICNYGQVHEAQCTVPNMVNCTGSRSFNRNFTCAFCYQMDQESVSCNDNVECDSVFDPNVGRHYTANCSVDASVICMGRRNFPKQIPCNWTGGHRWLTALILSITLGGFGADRFYLGHWQEGIGKLFSFGGLGVWTLVDVVMIAVRYVGPSDGSLYI